MKTGRDHANEPNPTDPRAHIAGSYQPQVEGGESSRVSQHESFENQLVESPKRPPDPSLLPEENHEQGGQETNDMWFEIEEEVGAGYRDGDEQMQDDADGDPRH